VGTCWLIGDGSSINIWRSKWLLRPRTFAVITAKSANPQLTKVSELIDYEHARWRESLIRDVFIPYDAELILNLPLCDQWPQDKLIWHYMTNGVFSVKSAYHLIVQDRANQEGEQPEQNSLVWKKI